MNQVMDELDELKGLLNQLQKSILQLERKAEKDQKEGRAEMKEVLEKVGRQDRQAHPGTHRLTVVRGPLRDPWTTNQGDGGTRNPPTRPYPLRTATAGSSRVR